jgi:dipeptidase
MSRGALVRQQKLEARELREQTRMLKESRSRLNGDSRAKGQQKSITQEIKSLEEELEKKHAAELEEFDQKHASSSKATPRTAEGKIIYKSINLDFSHIKFDSI